jgi:Rieske 2Fe-2S family protein
MAKAPSVGLTQDRVHRSWLFAEQFGLEHCFDRYPLLRGHVTGSRDGKPVAPLLGTITGYDGGATDWNFGR